MAFIPDKAMLASDEISPSAYRLFTYYCMRGGKNNPTCTAALERAASDLKMDYTYASRKRAELIKAGWIFVQCGTVYILKGIEDYTDEAQALIAKLATTDKVAKTAKIVAEKAISDEPKLLKQQVEVAKTASENCEKSNSHIKDEPASLTKQENQDKSIVVSSETTAEKISKSRTAQAVEIFNYWKEVHNKNGRTIFDAKRKRLVEARLKDGNDIEFIKQAIRGIKNSAYHMGENPERKIYDGLGLICRDQEQLEKLAALDEPRKRVVSISQSRAGPCRTCNDIGTETVCDTKNDFTEIIIPCRSCKSGVTTGAVNGRGRQIANR